MTRKLSDDKRKAFRVAYSSKESFHLVALEILNLALKKIFLL
jgi:hypothetical protein